MQYVADSWHSAIGSCAIMAITAFFDSDEHVATFSTDSERQDWATFYLEHNHLLYRQDHDDDPRVSCSSLFYPPSTHDCV